MGAWIWMLACGVPGNAPLDTLETEDRDALCEKHFTLTEPVSEVCDNATELDFPGQSVETCKSRWVPATCPVTVLQWTLCMESLADNPCPLVGQSSNPDCASVANCFAGGLAEPAGL